MADGRVGDEGGTVGGREDYRRRGVRAGNEGGGSRGEEGAPYHQGVSHSTAFHSMIYTGPDMTVM